MKKFFGVLALAFSLVVSAAMADDFGDAISKAQALKKTGDYVGAAKATPRTLCAAIYYWTAACQVVGHKDDNGDWWINDKLTAEQKTEGLRLLGLANDSLSASQNKAGLTAPDDGTCTGVDVATLETMISNVTACINGNCK
jgi:hypothetical protein